MIDNEKLLNIIEAIADKITAEKDYLTELDNVIGDGDHGINMSRGFEAVRQKLPTLREKDLGTVLKTVGTTLVSTVGGASGPLYGTAFMKAGNFAKGMAEINEQGFIEAFGAAIDGIKMRGKAVEGEKTMLDALCPAYNALEKAHDEGKTLKEMLDEAVIAAREGQEHTKDIIATKGRASYLGERSLGHIDPGATSSFMMLEVIAEKL